MDDAVRRRDEINIEEGGDPNAKVASETFGRALQQFGRRALVNLIALIGNYAETAALLTVFAMQSAPDEAVTPCRNSDGIWQKGGGPNVRAA